MKNLSNLHLPFFWGAATSAHQVEGGNRNDWSEWESDNARRLSQAARRREWPAHILERYPNPLQEENYISGAACDHYHRFREDFDIAKSLGHNAHRFSIEWSRIEPEEARFDEREIEHYRDVIAALRVRTIEPFVTLWHWTLPLWVRDKGGVAAGAFPQYFERYVRYITGALGRDVTYWMTLNEPTSVIVNGFIRGIWPPQKRNIVDALGVFRILAAAHRTAYQTIHEIAPHAQVGFGNIVTYTEPYRRTNILDNTTVRIAHFWFNQYFFRLTGDRTHDYIALQNYFHKRIQFPWRIKNDNETLSDINWELYPESLYHLLKEWGSKRKPIYITEHGLADVRDRYRAWYIREAAAQIGRARKEGVDVRGYFHWSLLDNFEWDKGFWPRFGLVEVNYKTLERTIRPSALEYKEIIENA